MKRILANVGELFIGALDDCLEGGDAVGGELHRGSGYDVLLQPRLQVTTTYILYPNRADSF